MRVHYLLAIANIDVKFWLIFLFSLVNICNNIVSDEGRFRDDYMEGQGTMKMNRNVIIPNLTTGENDKAPDGNDEADSTPTDTSTKHDWMIPIQLQSDISHIHQKAGLTQIGRKLNSTRSRH